MNDPFLRGRKQIMAFSEDQELEDHPILEWINGRPVALKFELIQYLLYYNEALEKRRKE
jgi:hypothetical protein